MVMTILKKALAVVLKKPFVLWGISLLNVFLGGAANMLFGLIPGISLSIILLLNTSMTLIFLHGYRGEAVKSVQLFDCFQDGATLKRVLGGMAWMYLRSVLWLLIPIVGLAFYIVKTYAYRLTPYILVMEPDVKATEAYKVSEERTKGYKGKMFGAEVLVYVGIFVVSLILGLLAGIPFVGVLFGLVMVVFILAVAALSPLYMGLVQAAFYEEIMSSNKGTVCPNCGKRVLAGSAFCGSCGASLKKDEQ